MKKAIIIGASSGIGRAMAKILSSEGYILGLAARRTKLLTELQNELGTRSYIKYIDVSAQEEAIKSFSDLIDEMSGVDMIIITSGNGYINPLLDWEKEKSTIDVNVSGVTAMINIAIKHFYKKGTGQLVVISSVAALRGSGGAPAYNATKAYLANYLEGIRCRIKKDKKDITVTDIRPGLVDTDMAKGEGLFWVQPVEKAAGQIYSKILRKKKIAYVTKRWGAVAFLLKHIPEKLLYKME
ncbi:MAG: SDR family NAD(P)-dependent oxidoreductase [Eubacteriales bacterium]|nr:SDR family NAD(P)-dependent oxidoreductase [Eubacteriales bacterium]